PPPCPPRRRSALPPSATLFRSNRAENVLFELRRLGMRFKPGLIVILLIQQELPWIINRLVDYVESTPWFCIGVRKRNHLSKNSRSEEHTSELQSRENLVCRLLL